MKFKSLPILILILINSITLLAIKEKSQKTATRHDDDDPSSASDTVYKRIKGYIYSMAEDSMKSSDLLSKKKMTGSLPEGYPNQTRKLALKTRDDIEKWRRILGLPSELFRFCIYPNSKINYVRWCNNNFFVSKNKQDSCLYTFCQVCCDHLVFVYKNAADKNVIGELLQFKQEQGLTGIMQNIDTSVIHQCKVECKRTYPVDMPTPPQKPPRDNTLGTQKNPGYSCMDIKKWGNKLNKSGVYWINVASKGPQRVFCDMETDKGGWTLFFNYVHQPGSEVLLDENKLPFDLKTNSHMYLRNAGFNHRDVKEVRFFCTERLQANKKYWHFKTMNREIIEVALGEDQTGLNSNSLASSYTELNPPEGYVVNYHPSVRKSQLGKFNYFGRNPKGGFTVTSFGSDNYRSYWTVKGDDHTQDVFECGSIHRGPGITSEDNPNMVFTHHSIWFRGFPPSEDEVRERYMANLADQVN